MGTPRRSLATTTTTTTSTAHTIAPTAANETAHDTTTMESWPDYIRRATRKAEEHLRRLNIEPWFTTYLRRKWRWAGRVASQTHDRWPHLAIKWQPPHNHERRASRPQGRPRKRWSDDFRTFLNATYHSASQAANDWLRVATSTTIWRELEHDFIQYAIHGNTTTPN